MSLGSTPVLRTTLHTIYREFSCPENGGEWEQSSMGKRVSDTLWDSSIKHGHCTANKLHLSDQSGQLQQLSCHGVPPDLDMNSKSMESMQTDIPVALPTRSKAHQQATANMFSNTALCKSQFEMETKDLNLQLIKQANERYSETSLKLQTICDQQRLI